MILIPEESINNLSRDNVATMQTPGTPTSRLDKEMSKIINSTLIQDDREKYAMYQQALERFMYYKKNDDTKKSCHHGVGEETTSR